MLGRRRHGLAFQGGRRRRRFPARAVLAFAAVAAVAVAGALLVLRGVPGTQTIEVGEASAAEPSELARAMLGLSVSPEGVEAARRYIAHREGDAAFAAFVPGQPLMGYRLDAGYPSASLSKAMLLVALLRQRADAGTPLDDSTSAVLESMITISDNEAANQIYYEVGDAELASLAEDAGMTSFEPTYWPDIELTPADQARLFMRLERLVPQQHRDYALDLLSSIDPEQTWGIPDGAGAQRQVFFKGGWRPEGYGWLVSQAARIEDRDGGIVSIAVLTNGNPSYEYGQQTIEAVTERLLRAQP